MREQQAVLGIMIYCLLQFKDNKQVNKKIDWVHKEIDKWVQLHKVLV
jgi:hypothetical protein